MKIVCFSCQKEWNFSDNMSRREECDCGEDIHVCFNCRFYDEGAYNECRESSADVVRDKERANFCDYFQPKGESSEKAKKEDLFASAEALFKKKD